MIENKICNKCRKELPMTKEFFYSDKGKKDGLSTFCKECKKQSSLNTYYKHKDKYRERKSKYGKEYYQKHRDYYLEVNAQWRKNNKERMKETHKEWYEKNKEDKLEKNRQWIKENKEYHNELKEKWKQENPGYHKEYRIKNRDKMQRASRLWMKNNPERAKIIRANAKNRRRAREEKVESTLTSDEWESILKKYNYRCAYCGSGEKIEMDHVVPISKGGGHTFENVVPACRSCNASKSNKDLDEWSGYKEVVE
ncbi:MAG TPA: HNH endonuclease [Fervidobacterium sp.]|nr:HNH endonuclease [Fervidobacterium sp.]